MKTYIALLRGINVGGKHLLPMKELGALLEGLGAQNVKTYIQSGNVVFRSKERDVSQFASRISAEIHRSLGFEPYVLVMEEERFETAIVENPFPEAECEPKTLHVGFLSSPPANPNLNSLESLKKESERFQLHDNVFYLHAPEGVGRSKLAAASERLLGVSMTSRNWRTVCKTRDLAREVNN